MKSKHTPMRYSGVVMLHVGKKSEFPTMRKGMSQVKQLIAEHNAEVLRRINRRPVYTAIDAFSLGIELCGMQEREDIAAIERRRIAGLDLNSSYNKPGYDGCD